MGTFPAFEAVRLDAAGFAFSVPRLNSFVADGIYKDVGGGLVAVADLTTAIAGGRSLMGAVRIGVRRRISAVKPPRVAADQR